MVRNGWLDTGVSNTSTLFGGQYPSLNLVQVLFIQYERATKHKAELQAAGAASNKIEPPRLLDQQPNVNMRLEETHPSCWMPPIQADPHQYMLASRHCDTSQQRLMVSGLAGHWPPHHSLTRTTLTHLQQTNTNTHGSNMSVVTTTEQLSKEGTLSTPDSLATV